MGKVIDLANRRFHHLCVATQSRLFEIDEAIGWWVIDNISTADMMDWMGDAKDPEEAADTIIFKMWTKHPYLFQPDLF